jgi:hypothetical protein
MKHYENMKSCFKANVLSNIKTVFCLRKFSTENSKPSAIFNFKIQKLSTKHVCILKVSNLPRDMFKYKASNENECFNVIRNYGEKCGILKEHVELVL